MLETKNTGGQQFMLLSEGRPFQDDIVSLLRIGCTTVTVVQTKASGK